MLTILPTVRGRYSFNEELSKYVWFKVGGPADVIFKPSDLDDLIHFLKEKPADLDIFILGLGSNLLIRDSGVQGVVIRLGKGFNHCDIQGDTLIAGAAALDRNVALMAADSGLSGFEFLASIPGTIGGALKMNAGCYGSEIKDILKWVKVLDFKGNSKIYTVDELMYTYRHCGLQDPVIFIEACFQAICRQDPKEIHSKISNLLAQREATQPIRSKTGGSTFKNPEGLKAWELIDRVGGRGLRIGDAEFSSKHCNFIINTGAASSKDIEDLGEIIRQRVSEKFGINLEWEIIRIGDKHEEKTF